MGVGGGGGWREKSWEISDELETTGKGTEKNREERARGGEEEEKRCKKKKKREEKVKQLFCYVLFRHESMSC